MMESEANIEVPMNGSPETAAQDPVEAEPEQSKSAEKSNHILKSAESEPEQQPKSAEEPEEQPKSAEKPEQPKSASSAMELTNGTILEAAFVDLAYSTAEGKSAIELQASAALMDDEFGSIASSVSESHRGEMGTTKSPRWWNCCRSGEAAVVGDQKDQKNKKSHKSTTTASSQSGKKERRNKERYSRVPKGILIYRLDTSTREIQLMSNPSTKKTNRNTLLQDMVVAKAGPSDEKSRRGISLVGVDGTKATLVACEQRTAIAWLEAMDMMLGTKSKKRWGSEKDLNQEERDEIEEQYLNLASYSNNLIRAGALPGQTKKGGGAGGIYYSVEMQSEQGDGNEEEALESIAKRRAVIKDSWDFYRMICSLLRDRRKYDEVFRKLQHDPVYPYLNSMTGLNDPGDAGYENTNKAVVQKDLPEYGDMSQTQVAEALVKEADGALPALVEICKALAGSLGLEEVGVGPLKEVQAAVRKAEKKYEGDLLKVTDYCRSMLVVKDVPSLLALLELARDSFGPLIRRVKLSTLKSDHNAMPGGFRDCKINLELKGHICEIQVDLLPMWTVCGVDGFRHYRHCVEYSTDSFGDPYAALDGLDRKTMAELVVMAEEAVAEAPLDSLEWNQEKYILDYFAEAGLFLKHGLDVWAEITLRQLIKLRTESPDIGPDHHETLVLNRYLEQALKAQGKDKEAKEVSKKIRDAELNKSNEKQAAEKGLWDSFMSGDAIDMIMDPNKKDREEEEKLNKEVKASKKQWRKIRRERFPFLDSVKEQSLDGAEAAEESAASAPSEE